MAANQKNLDANANQSKLDPVTFEVLKNAFQGAVENMAEQVLRTCHSFVLYNRDFSSGLCDKNGDLVSHGRIDLSGHIATMHHTCKAVIKAFKGDMKPGDVFILNDSYQGNTHWSDIRVVRPIFYDGEIIAYTQSSGHWADVGGNVPGSFDVTATTYFSEGLRITPIRMWDGGKYLQDVATMIVSNTRVPHDSEGDLIAQNESTKVGERDLMRIIEKYGIDTVLTAFDEVQDYVERFVRSRLAEMPDGVWDRIDYLDEDYGNRGDGLIPVKMKMIKKGTQLTFDMEGTHPAVAMNVNSPIAGTYSAIITGVKMIIPEIPLNSGFFRAVDIKVPEGSLVDARWPTACTGFVMTFEKLINNVLSIFSEINKTRAMACSFNLDYLLIGGFDSRTGGTQPFMLYDWLSGGWGGRYNKDGESYSAFFGVSLKNQPVEGQERLAPAMAIRHELESDSAGPGKYRGGLGVVKGYQFTTVVNTVASLVSNRARAVVYGEAGGLPSCHVYGKHTTGGVTTDHSATFANLKLSPGDTLVRPSGGGGGYGDPLERDPEAVLEDVIDEYVSIHRARVDYGVHVKEIDAQMCEYELDLDATEVERKRIRAERRGWLEEDPVAVVQRYKKGELEVHDLIRQYGIILDWDKDELLPNTTKQYRAQMQERSAIGWSD